MDLLLGKVTQQAMSMAIRSGLAITASYAFRESSRLLKTVEEKDKRELQALQERLKNKIDIISPAIDMIELIAARGNTSLESALSLTKALRWDIQKLGQRLASAANEEDLIQRGSMRARSKDTYDLMLEGIITDIKALLERIEDAVPLINLAITTSGATLSTSLPSTVSPSRLLQASTFITAGDNQYASPSTSQSVQIGPTFTLSLYMLFSSNIRPHTEEEIRATTWKEVIHKARLKLVRVPISNLNELPNPSSSIPFGRSASDGNPGPDSKSHMSADAKGNEFAYQMVIVEDLDDDRVHTYEDEDEQPGPYDDVAEAGIREAIAIHEISKIFYADTGKILNIGSDGETNTPVLLLKRDLNAIPPRRMMERPDDGSVGDAQEQEPDVEVPPASIDPVQSAIDDQLNRESRASSMIPEAAQEAGEKKEGQWGIPSDLDPEWLALEVYTEAPDSETESEDSENTPPTPAVSAKSPPAVSTKPLPAKSPSLDPSLSKAFSSLHLERSTPPTQLSPHPPTSTQLTSLPSPNSHQHSSQSSQINITTSLSLLETILRLLSLQQFQQTSHLAIPDELLNFFLSEAATTGAATGDEHSRRRLRNEARYRVGFDPYDESPIKRRGEEYQYRGGTSQRGGSSPAVWEREETWEGQPWEDDDDWGAGEDEGYATNQFSTVRTARYDRSAGKGNRASESPLAPHVVRSIEGREGPRTPSPRVKGKSAVQRVREDKDGKGRSGSPLSRPPAGVGDEVDNQS